MNTAAALTTAVHLHRAWAPRETLPTGLTEFDSLTGGFPRGAISEITGPESSGRTTLAHSILAAAAMRGEMCAWIDSSNSFDPRSACNAGVALDRVLWIRCHGEPHHALRCTDLVLHAGGFGAVVLDIADMPMRFQKRIPLSCWHRFRLAVENTPAVLAVVEREPLAKSCAALQLDLQRRGAIWPGAPGFELFRGIETEIFPRKPVHSGAARLTAHLAVC